MMNTERHTRTAAAIVLSVAILFGAVPLVAQDFTEISPKIMSTLDNIQSYDMTVSYSERIKGAKALVFRMKSDSSSTLRFVSPNLLSISGSNTTTSGGVGAKTVQKFTVYTTFDGDHQRLRSVVTRDGKSVTNSIMMDASINSPDQPFDGWNIKGFGLSEGQDYIGTIRNMLPPYDFVSVGTKGGVTEFKGSFNIEKCAALLVKTMPPEQAKSFAKLTGTMLKELRIRVDTKRHLVVGYTQTDLLAERTCSFDDIIINDELDDGVFKFHSLPDEEFRDITDFVKKSRERAQKRLAPKPDAADAK
ncbi:MAG: hypothetical protein ISS35_02130 [Kiritimatiellae bacterium]|nr:hypothetical protein [Kiritimatiellia bacterium]